MRCGWARRGRAAAPLAAGLLALAACGSPPGEQAQANEAGAAAAPARVPTAEQLAGAVRVNGHCACVLRGECVTLEEIYGHFELRDVQCAAKPGKAAVACRYESRFVEMTDPKAPQPSPWQAGKGLFTRYAPDSWCAGEG